MLRCRACDRTLGEHNYSFDEDYCEECSVIIEDTIIGENGVASFPPEVDDFIRDFNQKMGVN